MIVAEREGFVSEWGEDMSMVAEQRDVTLLLTEQRCHLCSKFKHGATTLNR